MKKFLPYILILIIITGFLTISKPANAQDACTVQSAVFNPSGEQSDNWYKDKTKQSVQVIVKTENCQNKTLELSIREADSCVGWCDNTIPEINRKSMQMGNNNTFILNLKAGETKCDAGFGFDCNYYIEISGDADFVSDGEPEGNLLYECDAVAGYIGCLEDWIVGPISFGSSIQDASRQNVVNLPAGGTTSKSTDTTYQPLARLPGLQESYDTAKECALGDYLNTIIKIIIGLCIVLAVFMIFIGGLEYMSNEIISNKEHGKERIRNAILGLLLALSAYTILNTINPALLNVCLKLDTVKIAIEGEVGILGKTAVIDGKTITACKEDDMVSMTLFGHSGVRVHKEIKANLERVNARWLAIPEAKRYKVNTVEGYVCKPVTNKPGYWSAHAFGLAIDINAATNPYGSTLKTDMMSPPSYPNYPFANVFALEGWGWGGNWSKIKDAMHFSKYPLAEQGNGKLN